MPTNRNPTGTQHGGQQDQGGRQNKDNDQNRDRKQTSGTDDRTSKTGMSGNDNPQKSSGKGRDNDR